MIEYMAIPENSIVPVYCTICHERAEYLIQFRKKTSGKIYFYICEHCFNKLYNDFSNDNLKEVIVNINSFNFR